jgi:hypothetical protein
MLNLTIFTTPLGFIKCIEFVSCCVCSQTLNMCAQLFTLIAFAAVAHFGQEVTYVSSMDGCNTVTLSLSYPFE